MVRVSEFASGYDFDVVGVSYIGEPRDGTAMFATRKVEHLLENLNQARNCLVFVDVHTTVNPTLRESHCIIACDNPETAYGHLADRLWAAECEREAKLTYTLAPGGYYIGEGVVLGRGVVIEPMVLLGHGVKIGDGTRIEAGTKIYHANVGKNCFIKGNSVIGNQSFFHYFDEDGVKHRLYQLGDVVIEDEVEIGSCTTVNRAVANSTVLRRCAMIDDHVYIPHDVEVGESTRILGGTALGGFCKLGKNVFVGLNSVLRNRITVGDGAVIGIGTVVTKSVRAGAVLVGNPGRELPKPEHK